MAVNIQSIQFKHLLYDESDKVVSLAKVQIQFYNVNTKSWLSLTDALTVTKGKLTHTLTIPSRISTKNQTIRVVREVLKSGGTPSFRIIKASTQTPPQVIATTFIATIVSDTKLTIDFGKSWLLDSKEYVTKNDHIVIATQVPMFQFTSAIRSMEIEKDTAVAQVAGLNSTITSLSDERTALQTQLATAQTNIQTLQDNQAALETQLETQRTQIETMEVSTGDVGAVAIERDNALAQVSGLNETITALSNQRTTLQDQLANAQNDIETKAQQVADLNTNLDNERELRQSLEAEKANLETELASQRTQMEAVEIANADSANYQNLYNDLQIQVTAVNQDNSNLQQQVADITIQRDDLAQQVSTITLTNTNLQQQVSSLTIAKDNLELEKVSYLASISQLQTSIQQEKALVKAKDVELQNKQDQIKALETANSKLQHDLAEAQDFSITDHPNKLSATKVLSTIVNDVNKADAELANSKFKLSNISLNLKTTVEKGPEGTILGLLDFESAKTVNSEAISGFTMDIVPSRETVTATVEKMPNILGLTETAVRKILTNYGLQLDAVYHSTNDDGLVAGQAFKQSPGPGDPIEEGQEVIVIFAKPIN